MEIVADMEMLENMGDEKLRDAVNELFGSPVWLLSPMNLKKLKKSKKQDINAEKIFGENHIATITYGKADRELIAKLSKKNLLISKNEIEGIVIAKNRNLAYATSDQNAREICIQLGVRYLTLPMMLKAFWAKKILTKRQVWELMERIEKTGNAKFRYVDAILGSQ
jgi:hypothetical protein